MIIRSLINFLVFLTFFVFIACSCEENNKQTDSVIENPTNGIWQKSQTPPIEFERILTIGNNENFILPSTYLIKGPVTDETGNIYFINEKNGKLYSFDSDGNMQWETGNIGKGPGDFQQPQGLATNGKYIYTANIQGSRLDKFNMKGEYVNSTNLKQFGVEFAMVEGFISDSLLVLGSTIPEKIGRQITVLNVTDAPVKFSQFEINPHLPLELAPGLSIGFDIGIVDTLIATGNIKNYILQFFDRRGNNVKNISRDFDELVGPGIYQTNGRRAVVNYSQLRAPIDLKKGYFITVLSWATNIEDPTQFMKQQMENRGSTKQVIYKNAIDLYDSKGTLLYTLENDGGSSELGTFTHVDAQGNIYTKSDEPFPQIRKYKVTISPSVE